MESNTKDSLEFVPMEKWVDLENVFKADGPRGIPAFNALLNQRKLVGLGLDYGFKVYCPYGQTSSGMVAFNKKAKFNEIIIQCAKDDTSQIEQALITTKIIDWTVPIVVPFLPHHMLACIRRVAPRVGMTIEADEDHPPHYLVFYGKERPRFENVRVPEDLEFRHLSEDDIDLCDSHWVNRYDGSKWFFQLLIRKNTGYGLFKNNKLVCWVFVNEIGALSNLFTLEEHRRKGYGKLLIQLLCNENNFDVFACCLSINDGALKLYESLGFDKFNMIQWIYMAPNK